ncbi:MAG: SPOR domain-containing protein [Campylobacterota bacterium]|nr:SPOR domain-containing protein [Campylobacterota bacterium]
MKKIIFLSLVLISLVFAANESKSWTIVVCSTKNIENADTFIRKNIRKNVQNIYVFNNAYNYKTTYGAFKTQKEALNFYNKFIKKINGFKPYIIKTKYNLSQPKQINNLVKLYKPNSIKKLLKKTTTSNHKKIRKQIKSNDCYTIAICSTSNIQNANNFIKNNMKNAQLKKIYILNYVNRYITTYGAFKSYISAKEFLNRYSNTIKNSEPYILRNKDSLTTTNKNSNIVKVILPKELRKQQELNDKNIVKKELNEPIKIIVKQESKTTTNFVKSLKTKKYKVIPSLKMSQTKLSGDLMFGTNGTSVDFGTIGVGKTNSFIPSIEVIIGKKHKVKSSYTTSIFSGNSKLSNPIILDNYTYNSGENISTNISTTWYQNGYKYNYKDNDLGLNIHSYNSDIKISNNTNTTSVNLSYLFLALTFDKYHHFNGYAIGYGGSIGKGSGVNYLDYYLNLEKPINYIKDSSISIGYSSQRLSFDDSIYSGKSNHQGIDFMFKKEF